MSPGITEANLDLRSLVANTDIKPEQKVPLVLSKVQDALTRESVLKDERELAELKRRLISDGVLEFCARALQMNYSQVDGGFTTAAHMAEVLSSCCVGVEPDRDTEAFHLLLLPSVMDNLLSLASQLMKRAEGVKVGRDVSSEVKSGGQRSEMFRLFKRVMESVGWLLRAHSQLATQVLSSLQYEQIQMCDDVTVVLTCLSLWTHICRTDSQFISKLSHDSVMLLLDDAVGQLAVSSDAAVGEAAVRLVLLIASQLESHPRLILHRFRGLDHLLNKDWRGQGFDQEVDQLIKILHSDVTTTDQSQASSECVRAACVIQAAWRAQRTRRRLKTLPRAVSTLQRSFRARRRQQEQQAEALRWEEERRHQVCVRRQRARREFHQKQLELMHLLPPGQVQRYLAECERQAAVVIQRMWRGYRQRKEFNTLRHTVIQHRAATTLQRLVLHFLKKRRALKAPPIPSPWIGQKGLTDSRRAELKRQVEEHIALQPSSIVSEGGSRELHARTQRLLFQHLQTREEERRTQTHTQALLAQINTDLELITNAPPLSAFTATDIHLFRSRSGPVAARARQSHNAMLHAGRLPWWRTLGGNDNGDDIISCLQSDRQAALSEQLEQEFGT